MSHSTLKPCTQRKQIWTFAQWTWLKCWQRDVKRLNEHNELMGACKEHKNTCEECNFCIHGIVTQVPNMLRGFIWYHFTTRCRGLRHNKPVPCMSSADSCLVSTEPPLNKNIIDKNGEDGHHHFVDDVKWWCKNIILQPEDVPLSISFVLFFSLNYRLGYYFIRLCYR